MSMIPKSRDNWLFGIEAHHANPMNAIHIPILAQMQRISGSPEMRPFATMAIALKHAQKIRTSIYLINQLFQVRLHNIFSNP